MSKSTLLAAGNTPTQEEEPVSFPGRSSLVHTLTHLGETERPWLSALGLAGTGGIRRETPASCFAK